MIQSRSQPNTRLRLSESKRVSPAQIKALFRTAGWTEDLARYSPGRIQTLLRRSDIVVSAWAESQLVGLGTAVTDGLLCGLVNNLIVHPRYRKRGVGSRLLAEVARAGDRRGVGCLFVLLGTRSARLHDFFLQTGFQPLGWKVYIRPRFSRRAVPAVQKRTRDRIR